MSWSRLPWQHRTRLVRAFVLRVLFLCVCVWFVGKQADRLRYAFSSATLPTDLGDVTDLEPAKIPTNAFVKLRGITEHRGMKQDAFRSLSLGMQEVWYFRLLGSGGVFVAVEPDAEKYGPATEITAVGRAVDPRREDAYRRFVATYASQFEATDPNYAQQELRIIEVGIEPGEGRGRFMVMLLLLVSIVAVNTLSFMQLYRKLIGANSESHRADSH